MKVHIKKLKQLDDITVNLGNVTLLIGGNNAGKVPFFKQSNLEYPVLKQLLYLQMPNGKTIYWLHLLVKMN